MRNKKKKRSNLKEIFFLSALFILLFCLFSLWIVIKKKEPNNQQEIFKPLPQKVEERVTPLLSSETLTLFTETSAPISSSQPTFFGKIFQEKEIVLNTTFGLEGLPYNPDEKRFFLSFEPGKLKNFQVFIDGVNVPNAYGFAQFPMARCDKNISENGRSITYTNDDSVYANSYDIVPFETEEECIKENQATFPPILFFFKPTSPLPVGPHTVKIISQGQEWDFPFTIASANRQFKVDYDVPTELDNEAINYSRYTIGDSCTPGYHYDQSLMPIPLPNVNEENTYSLLYLPQNEAELATFNSARVVKITFGDKLYDLNLPSAEIFYRKFEKERYTNVTATHLFIPMSNMVFTNGQGVKFWSGPEPTDIYPYATEYLNLLPVANQETILFGQKIYFETSGSSGCDG